MQECNLLRNSWLRLIETVRGRGRSSWLLRSRPILDAYVIEQAFRYNNRATPKNPRNDSDLFNTVVGNAYGRRLTYKQLTGKA